MAFNTLDEVIEHALMVGPMSEMNTRLKNELRDFFAHQTMIIGTQIAEMVEKEEPSVVLLTFFDIIFRDIPAIKK